MQNIVLIILLTASILSVPIFAYESGRTWASDKDLKEITGAIRPATAPQGSKFKAVDFVGPLPEWFDVRDVLETRMPSVRNQGRCGSCWAFGSTAAMEIAHALLQKPGNPEIDLSEQELVSCSKHGSCRGGWFAHKYQVKPGEALEEDFPYVAYDKKCKKNLKHDYAIAEYYYVGEKNRKPTVDELKAAIYEYGSVAVTVTANNAMKNYKSGIFTSCSNSKINHLVALVGWNDATKTWIMRNSWGDDWGEKGYMQIPWGCSRIGEDATFVVLK